MLVAWAKRICSEENLVSENNCIIEGISLTPSFKKFRRYRRTEDKTKALSRILGAMSDINKKGHFLQKKGNLKYQHPLFKPFFKAFKTK